MSKETNPTLIEAKDLSLEQIDIEIIDGISSEAGEQIEVVTEGRKFHSSGDVAAVATEAEYQGKNHKTRL